MNLGIQPTHDQLETIDEIITYIFTSVRKKVEGLKRNIPFSNEKEKRRSTMIIWKTLIRKNKDK